MRILFILLTTGIVFASVLRVPANVFDGILVIVNDAIVTYQEVESSIKPEIALLARQYGTKPQILDQKISDLREDRTKQLMERQLILYDFKTAGYNMPESIIDDEIQDNIRKQYGDRMTLTKTLNAEGKTYEAFRQRIRDQFIILALTQKNVSSEIIVSPHKIEVYYVKHRDEFKVEEQVKLRMIVLDEKAATSPESRKKLAEEILVKLKEGTPFSELAAMYSTGSQRGQGGDWGWVEKFKADGLPVLRKELFDVAFALKPGQHSDVIETPTECYLMLVEDRRATHIKTLPEVRDEIEKTLKTQEQARLRKKWIDRLKNKSFVRYF